MTYRTSALFSLFLFTSAFAFPAFAAPQASIKIEQLSPSTYGTWTLLSADGSSRSSADEGVDPKGGFTIGLSDFGQTTLSVSSPPGMSALISVYRGGDLIKEVASQQYSFPLYANDNFRFLIKYSLSRVGSLGVTSEPSALRFRMKGPTGKVFTATTPFTFKSLPAGKYSLYFPKTENCLQPAVKSVDVAPEERNTTNVTLTCNVGEEDSVDRSRVSKRTLRNYVEAREVKARGNRK